MYRPIQFIRKYSTTNRIKYPSLYSQINYYANKIRKWILKLIYKPNTKLVNALSNTFNDLKNISIKDLSY